MRQRALTSTEPAPSVTARATRRIVVFGGKGGVGTTTLAVNLAAMLTRPKTRNIVIDAAGGVTALLSTLEPRHTLGDVLAARKTLSETLIPYRTGLHVLPGCRHLVPSAEASAWGRLLNQVSSLEPPPAYAVIDAGSRPDRNAYNLWQAADAIVVVTTAETAAVMDAYAAIKLLAGPGQSGQIKLLLNRASSDKAAEAYNRLALVCHRFLAIELQSAGSVPDDELVQSAARQGEVYSFASPECPAAKQLRQAAQSIISLQPINSGELAKSA
jgi:flagellar biosynthesis protein FlhG